MAIIAVHIKPPHLSLIILILALNKMSRTLKSPTLVKMPKMEQGYFGISVSAKKERPESNRRVAKVAGVCFLESSEVTGVVL